ncbi:MAG: 4Fe-4S dicluster domain-containing protein [Peptostreptococcaceae bacterium]
MNYFVIANPDKCIGCRTCMIACVVEHSKENIFLQNPDEINFNPKLDVIKTDKVSAPIQCRHCEDAPCANACPNDGISMIDGVVKVNEEKCIGCKTCMLACPIGAIDFAPLNKIDKDKMFCVEKMIANKCDLCFSSEKGPQCEKVCPTKAFKIVKEEDMKTSIKDKRKAAALGL